LIVDKEFLSRYVILNLNWYELYELEEVIGHLRESMAADGDDMIFSITENIGEVAMVLIEKAGKIHVNEEARTHLQEVWKLAYEYNLKLLIPDFAQQLSRNELPINGVRVVDPQS
jgi:hypothetical protein